MISSRAGRRSLGPVLLLALSLGAVAAALPPAAAEVSSVAPSSQEVDPGGTTTAVVTVDSEIPTCVSARPSDERLAPSFSTTCDDEPTWRTTLTVQVPDEPGTYSVEIGDDRSNVTRRFELRVRAPAPPPPPPTTTAPPAPTTTTPPPPPATTTTTTPPPATTTTTTSPTTTAVAATSSTLAPPPPGGGFVSVASLVAEGVPEDGVFLPFTTGGYRSCLPLTEACVDPASAVVLAPARSTEIVWPTLAEGSTTPPRVDLRGLPPLLPVGGAPPDPGGQDYVLPILDLTAQGGQLRTLLRGLDVDGRLTTPRVGSRAAAPQAEGPEAAPAAETFLASAPFGRPRLASKDEFAEAAPAIPLFSATTLQVLYALRPDPGWGLDVQLLPLFGAEGVPYLVRAVDGPPGLYLARPTGLRIPQAGSGATSTSESPGDGDGVPAVALLGGAVGVGAIATGALALRRRRRLG